MIEATLRSVARRGLAGTTLATVSQEAGLSQGVAVFYFESKDRLLAEAFRHQYELYHRNWNAALEAAGPDPVDRLVAIVRADFDPAVFNPEALAVWHGFWGQATARPIYAEISAEFDTPRAKAVRSICAELIETGAAGDLDELARGVDALTDGLWIQAYLTVPWQEPARALRTSAAILGALFPAAAGRIRAGLTDQLPND